MTLSISDWHRRFSLQASWTRDLRLYLYSKFELGKSKLILDAGCGTGALLPELAEKFSGSVFGIDLLHDSLVNASKVAPGIHLAQADLNQIPCTDGCFDVCLLHYVLLWAADPSQCLMELRRVTKPGGFIIALAEPDYEARIDYPNELNLIGQWQRESLSQQGADPGMGRKLKELFIDAGLVDFECGVLGGQWSGSFNEVWWRNEWEMIEYDLQQLTDPPTLDKIEWVRNADRLAYQSGKRILFVPTFYAIGKTT